MLLFSVYDGEKRVSTHTDIRDAETEVKHCGGVVRPEPDIVPEPKERKAIWTKEGVTIQ